MPSHKELRLLSVLNLKEEDEQDVQTGVDVWVPDHAIPLVVVARARSPDRTAILSEHRFEAALETTRTQFLSF